jgi:aminomuconate-semialdehyde/2-hydroxymuconate-6-semialdehyde dehydrogenase
LGGKNPNIIFADCDIERAINISARAAFANQGQICLCGSRIFIERAIYEDFKKGFLQRVAGLKVGPPQEASSRMGALVSKDHLEKVYSYILLAQEEGGKILAGGNKLNLPAPYDKGYYLEPTVIEGLAFDCRTNQEEIFGPVVTLTPFDSEEEVLMMANSTEYGLACTIFTENLNKAHRVAKEVHTGIVWINDWLVRDLRTPFGGMKNSGVGREGGFEALKFFTESKNVCLNYY